VPSFVDVHRCQMLDARFQVGRVRRLVLMSDVRFIMPNTKFQMFEVICQMLAARSLMLDVICLMPDLKY
jgi:hypothetical protein